MQDSQILSTFQELAPRPAAEPVALYDACQTGVALRAVLFVEVAVAVGAMYGADGPAEWLEQLAIFTGSALPATVFWLVVACLLKRRLARLSRQAQYGAGVVLGALAGLYGCAMLSLAGLLAPAPWVASPIQQGGASSGFAAEAPESIRAIYRVQTRQHQRSFARCWISLYQWIQALV